MKHHIAIWTAFCGRMGIGYSGVPLFATAADGYVRTRTIGRTSRRQVLCRSQAMEQLVIRETDRLIAAWEDGRITDRDFNLFIESSFINREHWLEIGGATPGAPCWDIDIWTKLLAAGGAVERTPRPEKTHLLYRCAGIGFHFSGLMDGVRDPAELMQLYRQGVRNDPRFVAGEIELVPEWKQDYTAMINEAIANRTGEEKRA